MPHIQSCPKCKSKDFVKNGRLHGRQRYYFDLEKGVLLELGLPVLDEQYNISMTFEVDF